MGTKSLKVCAEHHRNLKIKAAEHGVSLQQYLALILELAFSEDPVLKQARDDYFSLLGPRWQQELEKARKWASED
jgi:hypothetical protein